MALTPKEIIKNQLYEYEKAKKKSDIAYAEGVINSFTHDQHTENLAPLIEEFRYALEILNKYT
jgi:hypothetical protein